MAKFITLTEGQNRITVNIDYIICYEANTDNQGSAVYINGYHQKWLSAKESTRDIQELIRSAYKREDE